jgi:hypothetical protein
VIGFGQLARLEVVVEVADCLVERLALDRERTLLGLDSRAARAQQRLRQEEGTSDDRGERDPERRAVAEAGRLERRQSDSDGLVGVQVEGLAVQIDARALAEGPASVQAGLTGASPGAKGP